MLDPDATDLSAADLDALIRRLVARRAAMKPVHPAVPPADASDRFHVDNMLWNVRPSADRPVLELSVYHAGLGWISMALSRAQVEDLEDAIAYGLRDLPDVFNEAAPRPALNAGGAHD